jgi:hypothetical protein|tara:strand:+ start:99 stop:377 length:279 start_codon:yes stop_codon:yes gene_type:complete
MWNGLISHLKTLALEITALKIDSKCLFSTHKLGFGFLRRSNACIRIGMRLFVDCYLVLAALVTFSDAPSESIFGWLLPSRTASDTVYTACWY